MFLLISFFRERMLRRSVGCVSSVVLLDMFIQMSSGAVASKIPKELIKTVNFYIELLLLGSS